VDAAAEAGHIPSSSSSAVARVMPVQNPSAIVYAVVSRSNRMSQTNAATAVVSSGSSRPGTSYMASDATGGSVVADGNADFDSRRDLYTQVIRRRDNNARRTVPADSHSLIETSRSVFGYAQIDDSPVQRQDSFANPHPGIGGYGYAHIDDPPTPQRQQNIASNGSVSDFYDVIRDDLSVTASSSDFDPNYESVPQTTITTTTNSLSALASINCVSGSISSGGTTAVSRQQQLQQQRQSSSFSAAADSGSHRQTESTTTTTRLRGPGFLIREHIYDEVVSPSTTTTTTTTRTTTCTTTVTHTDV